MTKYRLRAVLDADTPQVCRDDDGEIFVTDAPIAKGLPSWGAIHPRPCRCLLEELECGNCRHWEFDVEADESAYHPSIGPPVRYGRCQCPLPMAVTQITTAYEDGGPTVVEATDATECPCWEAGIAGLGLSDLGGMSQGSVRRT